MSEVVIQENSEGNKLVLEFLGVHNGLCEVRVQALQVILLSMGLSSQM